MPIDACRTAVDEKYQQKSIENVAFIIDQCANAGAATPACQVVLDGQNDALLNTQTFATHDNVFAQLGEVTDAEQNTINEILLKYHQINIGDATLRGQLASGAIVEEIGAIYGVSPERATQLGAIVMLALEAGTGRKSSANNPSGNTTDAAEAARTQPYPDNTGSQAESGFTTSRFDDTALEGQKRQQELLDSNEGFNISGSNDEINYPNGTLGNPNPSTGPEGGFTFLTDRRAFESVLGGLPKNGGTIKVTREQLNSLEDGLGLEPGSLDSGSVLRQFDNVDDLAPASPLYGNDFFRGPGNHLPDAGPEIVVNPAQERTNNPNIVNDWTIEVVDP